MTRPSRRRFLLSAGVALSGGLSGCLGGTTDVDGPLSVTPDDDRVDWKVAFDAPLSTRPAVASDGGRSPGDTLYVAAGIAGVGQNNDETGPLAALGTDDGSVEWHEPLDQPPVGRPVAHRGDCYLVTGGSNGFTGVGQRLRRFGSDGSEQWQTEPVDQLLTLLGIGDGRAYLGTSDDAVGRSGQTLYGTSLADGTWSWEVESGDALGGCYHDGRLLVDAGTRALAAHDPADGTEQWLLQGKPLSGGGGQVALADGTVYMDSPDDTEGIAAVDLAGGTTAWARLPEDVPTFVPTGAARNGDRLVATEYGGYVFGLDPSDGSERWRFRTDGETHDPPLLVDGVAYVGDQRGTVYAIDADTGDERWRRILSDSVGWLERWNDALVVDTSSKSGGELVVFGAGDGTERWRYGASADLSRPVLGGKHVYVVDEDESAVLALGREEA